jgi:tRNA isopentenyl-2-thiomethyl-A-37 hydroxylase MiaE
MRLNVTQLTTEQLLEIRRNSKAFIESSIELEDVSELLETHIKRIEAELDKRDIHYDERYPGPFGKYIKKEVNKQEKERNLKVVKSALNDGVSSEKLKIILKYYPISEGEIKKLNIKP